MSLEQCNLCIYCDRLVTGDFNGHWCPVREAIAEADGCRDFEEDDDRWDAAGTGGDA